MKTFVLPIPILLALVIPAPSSAQNVTNYEMISEPFLFLLREPAVHQDLALTLAQRQQLLQVNERFDDELLSSRNQQPESAAVRVADVLTESRKAVARILDAKQQARLEQIGYRVRGISFIMMPQVANQLGLSSEQRQQIEQQLKNSQQRIQELQEQLRQQELTHAEANRLATKVRQDEQLQILNGLTDDQRRKLLQLIGPKFDPQKLGHVSFRAPEFSDATTWINTDELQLGDLRDQVVVVHFFAFGCINCIRNYPWYREWHERYANQGVTIIGIHTPETQTERQIDQLREKMAQASLEFPVLVDNNNTNWNRWGNSMWPSVYLIDKQGRIRYWWYGELDWQGAGGQGIMARKIEELLAETD